MGIVGKKNLRGREDHTPLLIIFGVQGKSTQRGACGGKGKSMGLLHALKKRGIPEKKSQNLTKKKEERKRKSVFM